MRRLLTIVAILVFGIGMCGAVGALPGIGLDAAVTVPVPLGDFADAAKTGFGGSLEAFAGLPMLPLKIGGRVAYDRFSHEVGDGHTSFIEVLPSVRYGFGLPMGLVSVFAQFGAGMYIWNSETKTAGQTLKDDGTEFGLSAGVGATVMNFMFMPMYHVMFDEDRSSYLSLNVGMTF